MIKNFGKILISIIILISILLSLLVNIKAMFLFLSLFTMIMYINIMLIELYNIIIDKSQHFNDNSLWKIIFILISSVCFGVYFNI